MVFSTLTLAWLAVTLGGASAAATVTAGSGAAELDRTTVSVPDGGTVLLGGLQTLREARNEFGPPVLSRLPGNNRLFKNTSYGGDAESLRLIVTPRIIISEEEELRVNDVR